MLMFSFKAINSAWNRIKQQQESIVLPNVLTSWIHFVIINNYQNVQNFLFLQHPWNVSTNLYSPSRSYIYVKFCSYSHLLCFDWKQLLIIVYRACVSNLLLQSSDWKPPACRGFSFFIHDFPALEPSFINFSVAIFDLICSLPFCMFKRRFIEISWWMI